MIDTVKTDVFGDTLKEISSDARLPLDTCRKDRKSRAARGGEAATEGTA